MNKWRPVFLGLMLTLFLAACTSSSQESAATPDAGVAVATTYEVPDKAPTEVEPTDTAPATRPTEASEDAAAADFTQEVQVAELPTSTPVPLPTTPPEPTETTAPAFNGEYEGTFFRGLATAPITMIDYSDFL